MVIVSGSEDREFLFKVSDMIAHVFFISCLTLLKIGWKGGIGRNGGIRKNGRLEKRMGWINGGIGKKVLGVGLEAGV